MSTLPTSTQPLNATPHYETILGVHQAGQGKIYGIDLGLKHFAVVTDGEKVSKYDNPRHIAKHEKNLKRKQKKLARKQKGSNSRNKYRQVVAKVY